jgi:hypothetical protein
MQIELPEFPPIALSLREAPATIGAFYSALSSALGTINPSIDPNAHFVNTGEAVQIKSIADAQSAIARIMVEREGTRGSPDQPPVDNSQLAHYYTFKEIHEGKTLVQGADGKWTFSGQPIRLPTVFNFSQSAANPDPSIAFNKALSQLLIDLQTCWTTGGKRPNIGAMFQLQTLGVNLIKNGIRPEFKWADPSGA